MGALLNIQNMQTVRTQAVSGTQDWTLVSTVFRAEATELQRWWHARVLIMTMEQRRKRGLAVAKQSRVLEECLHITRALATVHVRQQLVCQAVEHRKEAGRQTVASERAAVARGGDGVVELEAEERGSEVDELREA